MCNTRQYCIPVSLIRPLDEPVSNLGCDSNPSQHVKPDSRPNQPPIQGGQSVPLSNIKRPVIEEKHSRGETGVALFFHSETNFHGGALS